MLINFGGAAEVIPHQHRTYYPEVYFLIAKIQLVFLCCNFLASSFALGIGDDTADDEEPFPRPPIRKRRFKFKKSRAVDYYFLYAADAATSSSSSSSNSDYRKALIPHQPINDHRHYVLNWKAQQHHQQSYYRQSPVSPVKFYLYTSTQHSGHKWQSRVEELKIGDYHGLKYSNYNPNYSLILLVHGFLSNTTWDDGEVDTLRRAYMETKTKANIIGVDYAPLASPSMPPFTMRPLSSLYYIQAIRHTPIVGKQIVNFIMFLLSSGYLPAAEGLDSVHMIGFSLGAHIVGYAGMLVCKITGAKVGRITGLDPAGFLFHFRRKRSMLDPSDAKFVDITHTAQGFYGFHGKSGHIDFYVNGGGPNQPGCVNLRNPLSLLSSCSHRRAYSYYAESIRNPHIYACQCKGSNCYEKSHSSGKECANSTIYGEHVNKRLKGSFNVQMKPYVI